MCALIDLKSSDRLTIEFRQSFASRFVSLMFVDRKESDDHDVDMTPNYDVQTIYLSGNIIPSLFDV